MGADDEVAPWGPAMMVGPPEDDKAIAALYKATSHRIRRHILLVMQEDREPLAPIDFERRFYPRGDDEKKRKLSGISYHFRVLEEVGLIDLVDTEPIRGSVKHYYRLSGAFTAELRDTLALDKIAELLEEEAADLTKGVMKEIVDIIVASGRPIR